MTNLKTLSANELQELIHMTNVIYDQVNNVYLHVKDHAPELVQTIDKLWNELSIEANRREDSL
jgi:hypothetical protein